MIYPWRGKTIPVLLWILAACPLAGATYTWTGGSGGGGDAWRQANNWQPSPGQGGPSVGDLAIFSAKGTSTAIGIHFNDGRGLIAAVGAIILQEGPSRSIINSSPGTVGTLRLDGAKGLLLANDSSSSTLALSNAAKSAMVVHFASGGEIRVASKSASVVLAGETKGKQGFDKTGEGSLRLIRSNSLSGSVVVSAGTLELASTAGHALGSIAGLRLETGATARLVGADQLGDSTELVLAGGTFRGAEGPAPVVERLGVLTLNSDSTIDLGASHLRLADSSAVHWVPSSTLTITSWGSAGSGDAGRLFFGIGGLTSTQLAQVYFADLGIRGAQLVGPGGELMPIPEAPVAAAAAALVGFIVWRERRRLLRAMQQRLAPRAGVSAPPADRYHSADG